MHFASTLVIPRWSGFWALEDGIVVVLKGVINVVVLKGVINVTCKKKYVFLL